MLYLKQKLQVQEDFGVEEDFWKSFQSAISAYLTEALFLEAVCKNSPIFVSYKFSSFFTFHSIPLQINSSSFHQLHSYLSSLATKRLLLKAESVELITYSAEGEGVWRAESWY